MPLQHFFAHILNQLFAGPVTAMMNWIGHPPLNPAAPINGVFTMELIAFLILLIFFAPTFIGGLGAQLTKILLGV